MTSLDAWKRTEHALRTLSEFRAKLANDHRGAINYILLVLRFLTQNLSNVMNETADNPGGITVGLCGVGSFNSEPR
ncbi:hypothetical protein BC938DRAFT_472968 [Jimgerdemannia flammicorona]|uniref:Uncharacterized protein n=1 Tax=Jimgerdemannia flammicorona TaxID=994334 RepID=A0A433Q519_9FUNG|nr:hypothetical protein BC938DRAFT_472968 [Jimgerdemannia flammicorona]